VPPTRAELLATELQALRDLWLEMRCQPPCTRLTVYPFKLLLKQRPALASMTLGDVLQKLRCKECDQRPSSAAVTDNPVEGESSPIAPAARTWTVDVL